MLVLAIVAFALAGAALVAIVVRGVTLRPSAMWWVTSIVSAGTMAFGALSLTVAAITPTKVVDANGVVHGLGGPGPFIALVFGITLWLLGAIGARLLYVGLPRARAAAAQLAAEEAELRASIAELPGR